MPEDMDDAVRTVLAGYEAFNRGDFDAAAQNIHPDMAWHRVAEFETPLEGRDAIRANMEPEIWASQRSEVLATDVVGDCVLCRVAFHAKGAGSGIEMSDEAWNLWRIRDGLAIEFRRFVTHEEAVAAAREQPQPRA